LVSRRKLPLKSPRVRSAEAGRTKPNKKNRLSESWAVGPTDALAAFVSRPQAEAQIGACKIYGGIEFRRQAKP
jgi:hypothetical protein